MADTEIPRGDASGHPLPSWLAAVIDSRVTRPVVVAAGLLFAAWVTMAALFGSDTLVNPIFGTVYVLLWVGLVPAALLFGRVYRLCNPLRWLHRGVCKLAATDPRRGAWEYPVGLGCWPGGCGRCAVRLDGVRQFSRLLALAQLLPALLRARHRAQHCGPAGLLPPRARHVHYRLVATGRIGDLDRRNLPSLMAHSVVPIVVGYIVAHYLSYFVVVGITTVQQLGDPFLRGWTLTAELTDFNKYAIYNHPTALAVVKVAAVVTGHVCGVIAAHDRAVRLLPRRHAVAGQLPMLLLMVGYTLTGLWLLFSS